jgi:ABC-type nitrate/sulfonate/bicarbonate transport system permease component
MKHYVRAAKHAAVAALLPVLLITAWWSISANARSFYFPPLSKILEVFRDLWIFDLVNVHVVPSLTAIGLGLTTSILAGITLGVILGLTPVLHGTVDPVLQFLRCLPAVALLPLTIQLIGIGLEMRVSIIALGATWPILLNTVDGVRSVHPSVLDMASSYRLKRKDFILRVILPSASPQIFAGVRASLSVAVILMVASELLGSFHGMGYFILESQRQFSMPEMWSGMILLGIIGYLLNVVFGQVEKFVLAWHRLSRSQ